MYKIKRNFSHRSGFRTFSHCEIMSYVSRFLYSIILCIPRPGLSTVSVLVFGFVFSFSQAVVFQTICNMETRPVNFYSII